jgi:hypothetical protein
MRDIPFKVPLTYLEVLDIISSQTVEVGKERHASCEHRCVSLTPSYDKQK